MKRFALAVAALASTCLLSGCGTRTVMIAQARPAIAPAAVRVYRVPPRHFERIAIINSSAGTSWIFSDQPSMVDTAIANIREQAAAVGANGVLLEQVYDEPAGGLTIGIGGFGFGGGRHNFYAAGGSGAVGGPLINHRVQATAIYVR